MIVDTSAVVAILLGEPGVDDLARALLADPHPRMSAGTYVELAGVVAQRSAPQQRRRFESLVFVGDGFRHTEVRAAHPLD